MKIELFNTITHDGKEYGWGVHELPEELARQFLSYTWAARATPGSSPALGKVIPQGGTADTVPPGGGTAAEPVAKAKK